MNRLLKRLLIVAACLFGLLLVVGLIASSMISGASKQTLATALSENLGVPVTLGAINFNLAQLFLLKPAITVEDIAIGNPPSFRSPHLLEAKKLTAQISLLPLLRKSIEVHSITIDHPRIMSETNAHGVSNIEALLQKDKGKSDPGSGGTSVRSLVVDEFSVASGEISSMTAAAAHTEGIVDLSGIDLRVRDFSRDQPCRLEFSARPFGGKYSRIKLEAQAGPFAANALPLHGTLSITVAPSEIPPALRVAQFGNLLVAPGKKAKVSLTAKVDGDAYEKLSGPATLALSDLLLGKDEQHVLPVSGEFPISFAASKLMSSPRFQLGITGGRLHLGKGEWLGDAELHLHGTASSGRTSGKIRNVDINELVSSVTVANGKIYGTLEIPSYSLQFAGNNAAQVRNSLHGSGKLSVTEGRIAALDLLSSIQQGVEHPQDLIAGKKGATPFTTLAAGMNVGESKLNLDGIQLESPALRVTGKGFIDFDQSMNFELVAQTQGGAGQMLNKVAGFQAGAGIPVSVTGTVESPKVRPSVGKIVQKAAQGLLDSFFKKKNK
ncbi:MAG: hypothetical protein DMG57_35845 [Acidobacteria bacterium]|nr:MAG: hypothetical protein DMG57_35845 [Acidobacteriota bacterium]